MTTSNNSAVSWHKAGRAEPDSEIQVASRTLATIVPIARLLVKDDQLLIRARNECEFNISIIFCKPCFIVNFDDWHEQFHDLEMAVSIVSQAILGVVRLKVDRIAGRPWRWTVERKTRDGVWGEIYSNSIFMFEWGRPKDTIYRIIGSNEM